MATTKQLLHSLLKPFYLMQWVIVAHLVVYLSINNKAESHVKPSLMGGNVTVDNLVLCDEYMFLFPDFHIILLWIDLPDPF